MKANRTEEGLAQINHAIALEPFYADSYVFKASAHEWLGQTGLGTRGVSRCTSPAPRAMRTIALARPDVLPRWTARTPTR